MANVLALAQQVRDLDAMVRSQEITIRQMTNAIGSLEARLRQAEAALVAYRISNLGIGPTVKN